MATYEIRPHGRTKGMFGYTLVTIDPDGTPLMVFSNERQAKETVGMPIPAKPPVHGGSSLHPHTTLIVAVPQHRWKQRLAA
jgi:hypothetical protein